MNKYAWLINIIKKLAERRKGAEVPDVPKQYKAAVDRSVFQVMHAVEDLVAFSGELGSDVIELESENLMVRITHKGKKRGKKIREKLQ